MTVVGVGVDADVAGTLGTKSGGGRTTDLDNAGAYVVNAPTNDVVAVFQQSSMTGKGTVGFVNDPNASLPVRTQSDHQMIVLRQEAQQLVNAPTDDVVGTINGGGIQAHTTGRTPTPDFSYPYERIVNAVTSKWAKGTGGPAGDECQNLVPVFVKSKRAQSNTDDETWIEGGPAPTLNQFDQGDTRATVLAIAENQRNEISMTEVMGSLGSAGGGKPGGQGYPAVLAFDSTFSGMSTVNDDLSPTIKVGSGLGIPSPPAVLAPSLTASNDPSRSPQSSEVTQQVQAVHAAIASVRRLTPLECERLQGWPDNHTAIGLDADGNTISISDSARYRMIGNGVASPVAAWIARHIANVEAQQ